MLSPQSPHSGWTRAVVTSLAAAALSVSVAAYALYLLDKAGVELLVGSLAVCPMIGLACGASMGWTMGSRAFLYPLSILPALYGAHGVLPQKDVIYGEAVIVLMALTLPIFSAVGVLLGGWLSSLSGARSKARSAPHVYVQALFAFGLAFFGSAIFSEHLSSLMPARMDSGISGELSTPFLRFRCLLYLAAVLWWVRPIHLYVSTGRQELKALARRRAGGIYGFVAGISAVWAIPSLLGGGAGLKVLLRSATEAYYLAYLGILCLEPYLFTRVMPALYEGPELFERKSGATLSIRLKLWLMVASLVIVPMLLVSASLVKHHSSLAAIWPVPLSIIIVALCYIIGYCEVLYQSITRPLAELVRKMELVAAGDFTVRTSVLSEDELGLIKAHFNDMVEGLAERERLRDTFGRYVSVEVAKQLMKSGKIGLGGENIEATILFSDIRDFTPMSEKMTPQALVGFLNSYFSYITEPIGAHHGVVNKFIGDAVMAIFAPQFGSSDHVGDAVRAALAMRRRLEEFNAAGIVRHEVRFGVGIHTGILVAGNIGTEARLEYTVIGDTVNVASRIESLNKDLDSTLLMSEDVFRGLTQEIKAGLRVERCENIRVKGKESPLALYKILKS